MNFGKIAFGAFIVATGVVLLAIRMGFAPPDTGFFLVHYWPVLLIAFGLAFLASAIKNPLVGSLAVFLILGGTAFGVFWMNHRVSQGKVALRASSVDLSKTKPQSLSVRVRTSAGRFYIGGGGPRSKALAVRVRTFASDSTVAYRFASSGKDAVFEWPLRRGWLGFAPPGTGLDVRVPETVPMTLTWRGQFASMHADLTRLKPRRCELNGIASSILFGFKDAERPEEIRIGGFAENVLIRIHGDCPVRLVSRSPFVMRTLASDFVQLARGRGKDTIHAGEGRGSPVRIFVEGSFIRIKIERLPSPTV